MAHLEEAKINFKVSKNFKTFSIALIVIGLLIVAAQIFFPWHHGEGEHHGNPRLFLSLQMAVLFALPLSLGGVYFVAFNHLAGSAWNVSVRRIAENYFWYLPVVLILMVIIFVAGMGQTFQHWATEEAVKDHLIQWKSGWLNVPFFSVRNVLWLTIWFLFGYTFYRLSTGQDKDGDARTTLKMSRHGARFLVIFALTWSAAAWDNGMSLEPHWFSTMWAVYAFAGLALTTFSSIVIWVWYLKRSGYYGDAVNENHIHDLGKYMWGHTIFWGYIGISQFILIWYGNMPEEIIFYHTRLFDNQMHYNQWSYVSLGLVILRFFMPFLLIIRRDTKRNLGYLATIACLILVGQIVDIYWLAYPTLAHGEFIPFSWQEVGPLLFVIGSFMLVVGKKLSSNPLVPLKDPRLEDCLHWHQ